MEFVTIAQLEKDLVDGFGKIPKDIDLVVGIPRSGMLVASMIALQMNLPLADLNTYLNKKTFSSGTTKSQKKIVSFEKIKKVLVVEDSVCHGNSILEAKETLKNDPHELIYFAAYVTEQGKRYTDYYLRVIDFPRIFEWNYLHNNFLQNACCDIDGVLCDDPSDAENDDGKNYIKFILNTPSKLLPTASIGYIVTSRLEKYRPQTEAWLKKNGIEYQHLIMMNVDTAEERRALGNHAVFKAEFFGKCNDALWFIESDAQQAESINNLTKKPVFCVENHLWYDGSKKNEWIAKAKINRPKTLKQAILKIMPQALIVKLKKIKNKAH